MNVLNFVLRLLNPTLDLPEVLHEFILDLLHLDYLLLQPLVLFLDLVELSCDYALGLPQCMLQLLYRLGDLSSISTFLVLRVVIRVRVVVCKFDLFKIVKLEMLLAPLSQLLDLACQRLFDRFQLFILFLIQMV